jgi:hypothetical protein
MWEDRPTDRHVMNLHSPAARNLPTLRLPARRIHSRSPFICMDRWTRHPHHASIGIAGGGKVILMRPSPVWRARMTLALPSQALLVPRGPFGSAAILPAWPTIKYLAVCGMILKTRCGRASHSIAAEKAMAGSACHAITHKYGSMIRRAMQISALRVDRYAPLHHMILQSALVRRSRHCAFHSMQVSSRLTPMTIHVGGPLLFTATVPAILLASNSLATRHVWDFCRVRRSVLGSVIHTVEKPILQRQ